MITYTGYKLKVIFIIFLFLGYHVVAYAEMGRDREFCYPGSPENNTTPAVFYYNFGTTIISDINNNIPGAILPEKTGKLVCIRLIVIPLAIMRYILAECQVLIHLVHLVFNRGVIYLFQ